MANVSENQMVATSVIQMVATSVIDYAVRIEELRYELRLICRSQEEADLFEIMIRRYAESHENAIFGYWKETIYRIQFGKKMLWDD